MVTTRNAFAPRLEPFALVVKNRGGGERVIEPAKFFIDRSTPVGEDADFYEHKLFGGKRFIPLDTILRK